MNEQTFQALPRHVLGIIASVQEEAKAQPRQVVEASETGFASTRLKLNDDHRFTVVVSHTIYPEESVAVVFEDHTEVKSIPQGKNEAPIDIAKTATRHYQPAAYLGKHPDGSLKSTVYTTDVSRLDEQNIESDIYTFMMTGVLPVATN